ncbi:hypothetical protein C1H46_043951 [Malus baccata]|uniref:Uncharacterized protein n=1 Tax=Malus baccata TaxID=106549 RepID=A0A540K8G0_MALBA|nr:hypothetical protein C1H46_043951 [Malus baccata]
MPQQTPERGIGSNYGIRNSVFCDLPPFTSFQEPAASYAALQTQKAIAAQGMPEQQQQELGLGWSYGNYVPLDHLPPVLSLRDSTQFQEPDAALHAQEVIAARQSMPQQTRERYIGSHYGIHNSISCDLPQTTSFQEPVALQAQESIVAQEMLEQQQQQQLQQLGQASYATLQAQKAIAVQGMPEKQELRLGMHKLESSALSSIRESCQLQNP